MTSNKPWGRHYILNLVDNEYLQTNNPIKFPTGTKQVAVLKSKTDCRFLKVKICTCRPTTQIILKMILILIALMTLQGLRFTQTLVLWENGPLIFWHRVQNEFENSQNNYTVHVNKRIYTKFPFHSHQLFPKIQSIYRNTEGKHFLHNLFCHECTIYLKYDRKNFNIHVCRVDLW